MAQPAPINEQDQVEFAQQRFLIFQMLTDGAWHTRQEIEFVSGAAEAMRRCREFREPRHGGWDLQKTPGPNRTWLYRLRAPSQ